MVVYIVVIVVVIIGLYAAYRTMGGSASIEVPPRDLLQAAQRSLHSSLSSLDDSDDGAVRRGRRAAAAAQTFLDRVPSLDLLDDPDRDAYDSLSAAASDATAVWRIAVSDGWRDNPGLVSAVDSLRSHATTCVAAAESLVGVGAEPVEGGG